MLTAEDIENGKAACRQIYSDAYYGDDNSIRIAYEWLDAQKKLKQPRLTNSRPLKHIIEKWGNRYISRFDVALAAYLHPDIKGRYPCFNISAHLIEPRYSRLRGIGQIPQIGDAKSREDSDYSSKEV